MSETSTRRSELAIWWFAFGYFACYAPYSALTKALSSGLWTSAKVPGLMLLPVTTLASLVGMFVFISLMGWWRHATHRRILGRSVPSPGRWTLLSGLCTAAIIGSTTLSYTFAGTSIVLMMLFMRGGVLVLAPIVDALSGRHVRWFSWTALALSLVAVLIVTFEGDSFALTVAASIDVAVYLGAYFVRLRFMSHLAKTHEVELGRRYFVEEQMVATPAIVLALSAGALVGGAPQLELVRDGFTGMFARDSLLLELLVGLLSQGTGIFGALILLDGRENSFCVPVNRASSVLAGVLATFALTWFGHLARLDPRELVGAVLLIAAIVLLAVASRPRPGKLPARPPRPRAASVHDRTAVP